MAQVTEIVELSPHLRRIILGGDELADFPIGMESAHVKVILPQPGKQKPKLEKYDGHEKWMRSYTIRHYDANTKSLTIDFAVNDHNGLATNWAAAANIADYVGIAGPGEKKYTKYDADWHLLIGDLTALPAIAAILENLPSNAMGYAIVQVPTKQDIQILNTPKNVEVKWIINATVTNNLLLDALQLLTWLEGSPAIFIAAETKIMKAIRKYVEGKPEYKRELTYASAYWTDR